MAARPPQQPEPYKPPGFDAAPPPALSRTRTVVLFTWPVGIGLIAPVMPLISTSDDVFFQVAVVAYGLALVLAVANSIFMGIWLSRQAKRTGQRLSGATVVMSVFLTIAVLALIPVLFFLACIIAIGNP